MALTLVASAGVLGVAALVVWAAVRVTAAIHDVREDAARQRSLHLLALLAPGSVTAREDPKALLAWQPVASLARRLCPEECAALDRAAGTTFPFGADEIQAAHTRWTSAWLAWEAAHDAEYKARSATLEEELRAAGAGEGARAGSRRWAGSGSPATSSNTKNTRGSAGRCGFSLRRTSPRRECLTVKASPMGNVLPAVEIQRRFK